jgi:hypothetical protein
VLEAAALKFAVKQKARCAKENNMAENKKPLKVIKEGDMSPETKALPDEVVKPPKGIGESEKDMGPIKDPKKNSKGAGLTKPYKKGGSVSSASSRADGIATKGKTRGKIC